MNQDPEGYCKFRWFAERDIDVWLAEELGVNAVFASWFLNRIGILEPILTPTFSTRVSVVNGRETDVEALFHTADGKIYGVLIEDKIAAGFQENQMENYLKRGESGIKYGKWINFKVAIFAPSWRIPLDMPDEISLVTFEEAANFLNTQTFSDSRIAYRIAFLKRAALKNIPSVGNPVPAHIVEWWTAVYEMVRDRFGGFFLDRSDYTLDKYINPKCKDMSTYLRIDLKGAGEVALAFIKGFGHQQLEVLVLGIEKPQDIEIGKKTLKNPSLCIRGLPKYEPGQSIDKIESTILLSYVAAYKLMIFQQQYLALFDSVVSKS